MAIEVIHGSLNINGKIKEKGSRLQLEETEEKRLIALGVAKSINASEEIEEIEVASSSNEKKGGK